MTIKVNRPASLRHDNYVCVSIICESGRKFIRITCIDESHNKCIKKVNIDLMLTLKHAAIFWHRMDLMILIYTGF